MSRFQRISSFEVLTAKDARKLFGGDDPVTGLTGDGGTSKTVPCTVVTTTAGGTCNNNTPDNSVDSGSGSECVAD